MVVVDAWPGALGAMAVLMLKDPLQHQPYDVPPSRLYCWALAALLLTPFPLLQVNLAKVVCPSPSMFGLLPHIFKSAQTVRLSFRPHLRYVSRETHHFAATLMPQALAHWWLASCLVFPNSFTILQSVKGHPSAVVSTKTQNAILCLEKAGRQGKTLINSS